MNYTFSYSTKNMVDQLKLMTNVPRECEKKARETDRTSSELSQAKCAQTTAQISCELHKPKIFSEFK